MKTNLGHKLLAVYLIVVGALQLFGIHLGVLSPLVPLLALIAGICLLVGK
jgi:hypothetical protein